MGEEYYLKNPLNQKFYEFVADMMTYACVGNRLTWGYKKIPLLCIINRFIIAYFGPVCVVSQIFFLYFNFSKLNFDILGIIFTIFPVTCLANTLLFVEKFSLVTTYYVIFFFLMTWTGWISVTAVNNFVKKELELNHTMKLQTCIYFWMPSDYSYDYDRWLIIHLINSYTVFCGVCAIMMFQSQNYIYIYNLIGHILILKHKIKTEFNDNLTDTEVQVRLGKIVGYHIFICKVFKRVETAFGINVAATYSQNLVGNSIVLYQLMYGDKENKILYVMMIMAYTGAPIIMMSLVLEEIRRQTWDLSGVAYYELPWQNISVPNQKLVMLIVQRMQIIMDFKAFGGLRAGVGPMISILKTTFSYYVMIKTTMNEED